MFLERIPVRFRLSLVHTCWISALFFIVGYGLFKIVEHTLIHSVDVALISSAQSVRDLSRMGGPILQEVFVEKLTNENLRFDHLVPGRIVRPYAHVISLSGKVDSKSNRSVVSLPITPKALSRAESGQYTLETFTVKDRPPLRQVTLPILHNGSFSGDIVQVGASLGPTYSILRGTAILLSLLLPLVLLISVVLGYLLTAQALKPVVLMSQAASKLGVDDLSFRLAVPPAKDELQELSLTFNAMLDRLEDAITRLRRFTADVSHELRTPLAVLRGETELALRKERSAEEYRTSLRSVNKESQHMTVIVEDLLLLARAESSNVAFAWEQVRTETFVNELIETVTTIFKQKGIQIDLNSNGPTVFHCSKTYLSLALKNILLNACKHSAPNSSVKFTVLDEKNSLNFIIKDDGEGIPEHDLPYIFDPFYRCDTARNRAAGGVGIGLSLTLALIKLHRGSIQVASEIGKGTTFSAKIPLAPHCG